LQTLPSNYWQSFFSPPDERKVWEWARDTIKLKNSPFGARFLPDLTPWLKEPLEEIAKNENTEITCQCCVQGGKTVLMQVGAAWAIAFEPGPMMFNCQTDDDADDFAKERWATSLMSIPGIEARMPQDKARRSFNKLSLADMFMLIQGANRQNLQSKSIRWLFNDEVFLWKSGLLDEARKRTTQYWNRRRVNGSTAGERDCDLDRAFEAGDRREWCLACPSCGGLSTPKWERINYKDSGGARPDGTWDYKIVKAGTVYICEHCPTPKKTTSA
jgi:phage terminase large subunit GpA-like protein